VFCAPVIIIAPILTVFGCRSLNRSSFGHSSLRAFCRVICLEGVEVGLIFGAGTTEFIPERIRLVLFLRKFFSETLFFVSGSGVHSFRISVPRGGGTWSNASTSRCEGGYDSVFSRQG